MKNVIKIMSIIVLTITCCHCSKNDDNNSTLNTSQLLIGKWYYSVTSNGSVSACEAQSYYHFIDSQTLKFQHVLDNFGINISGFDLIGDCFYSNYPHVNYTLNEADEVQFLNEFENIITLKIISVSQTKLVFTKGNSSDTSIFILTKVP